MNVEYCQECVMPNTRPRVVFDEERVCNACRYAKVKDRIDWEERRRQFLSIIEPYRATGAKWNCVVPWSGGKDSSTIAYRLKFEFGLNPLLVTFAPLIPNEVGQINRETLIKAGFDHVYFRPNQKVMRHLAHRFFLERGNQKVAWDAGVNVVPIQVALQYKIPLVFYAEHGESEYGGRVLGQEHLMHRNFTEVIENQIGDDPRNWVDAVVSESDLNPYVYPKLSDLEQLGLKAYYFGYFFRWSMLDNFHFIKDRIDFKTCPEGRTEGTFTDFDSLDDKTDGLYYYMQFIKFGFGRTTRDTCRMIQNNQMSREEAIRLVHKYDQEFPERFFQDNLEYLSLGREEALQIIDMHRNGELWENKDNGWRLRFGLS